MADLMNLRTFLRGGYRADRPVTVISRTQVLGTWTPARQEVAFSDVQKVQPVELRQGDAVVREIERKAEAKEFTKFSPAPKPSQKRSQK